MVPLKDEMWYALRSLSGRPGFAAVAVLTLSLGVGASTAMFSVLHAVVLQPLPYPEPERVVRLYATTPEGRTAPWTGADFADFTGQASAYEAVAGFQYIDYSVREEPFPAMVYGVSVTSGFFQVFGVPPLLGRSFSPSADPPGGSRVVVLSHGLWRTRFAGDAAIVGRTLDLNGESYAVVGVMPPGFEYPDAAQLWVASRYRAPEASDVESDPAGNRDLKYFSVVARLREGVSLVQAREEGKAITGRLAEAYPETNKGQGFDLTPLHEVVVGSVRPMLLALLGSAGLVLVVACANVANLLLARAAARTHEIAVRAALGAGRRRIARQLLAESVLLGVAGGVVGVILAYAGTRALLSLVASQLPRAAEVSVSVPVLAFALAISLLSGLLFGMAPTLWLGRQDPSAALREAGSRTVVGGVHGRARAALVAAQMAVSLALLVGVSLLVRTLGSLGAVDPGFTERNALTAQITMPGTRGLSDDSIRAFYREALQRVRALPGVVSAGAVLSLPVDGGVSAMAGYSIEGRAFEPGRDPVAGLQAASPGYFESIGIPVLRGRSFTEADGPDGQPVMIVSQAFAERFFPGEDPIGRLISTGSPKDEGFKWATIVGVVGSVRYVGLDSEPRAEAYQPLAQRPWPWIRLVMRTNVAPGALAKPLRRAIAEASPAQPVERILTMEDVLHDSLERQRMHTLLLGIFAALALVLAAVGLYGVMSFSVAQRSREIGIRIAVGADRFDIARLVVAQGARILGAGLVVGAAGSLLVGRLMEGFLFGVPPADPASFTSAAGVLTAAALLALWLPALRAVRTDPMRSLRVQ